MEDFKGKLKTLVEKFAEVKTSLNTKEKKEKVRELEKQSSTPDFWRDSSKATKVMRYLADLKTEIEEVEKLEREIETISELIKMASNPLDYKNEIYNLEKRLDKLTFKTFLSGEYDSKNAIMAIHAGQGGTEAMDWASMLYRMYLKYAEKKGFKVEIVDKTAGEEAGIKSITFKVNGAYAYGYLRGEAGTHRLVRQSPFNADRLRQTSFALVEVLPELEEIDLPEIKIKDEDCQWQFFRSSSQGGQNVQKVSTAVRLKHLPSQITVSSQTQRFQEQNRKLALDLLRARLWLLEQEKKKKKVKVLKGEYKPASWGMQIRSYILHPYKMVKDLRTGVESLHPENVLAGFLDEFVEKEIKLKK